MARGVFPLAHHLETVKQKSVRDQISTSSLEDTKEGGTWEKQTFSVPSSHLLTIKHHSGRRRDFHLHHQDRKAN